MLPPQLLATLRPKRRAARAKRRATQSPLLTAVVECRRKSHYSAFHFLPAPRGALPLCPTHMHIANAFSTALMSIQAKSHLAAGPVVLVSSHVVWISGRKVREFTNLTSQTELKQGFPCVAEAWVGMVGSPACNSNTTSTTSSGTVPHGALSITPAAY